MPLLPRCLLVFILSAPMGIITSSALPPQPGSADIKIAEGHSLGSFEPTPAPLRMLLIGGGLVLFGGLLRRRLRT